MYCELNEIKKTKTKKPRKIATFKFQNALKQTPGTSFPLNHMLCLRWFSTNKVSHAK